MLCPTVGAKNVHTKQCTSMNHYMQGNSRMRPHKSIHSSLGMECKGFKNALSQSYLANNLASKPCNGRFNEDKDKNANIPKNQNEMQCNASKLGMKMKSKLWK